MYSAFEKSCLFIITTLYHQTIFCIILFILISGLTFILKKKSPLWQLGLWFLILIRLILPTDLNNSFSARNIAGHFLSAESFNTSLDKVSGVLAVKYQPNQNSELRTPAQAYGRDNINVPTAEKFSRNGHAYLLWPVILSVIWFLGSLTYLFLFINRIGFIRRVLDHSSLVRDDKIITIKNYWRQIFGITRPVLIYSSDRFLSPFTTDIFRPKIFIPEPFLENMDNETINSIIAHEMVHIKHFDHLWIRLQNALQIIYFFNPIVWYANGQINIARERLCDHVVLGKHVIHPRAFGKSIIDVLQFNLSGYRLIEPLLGFSNHKKIFEYRIRNILKENTTSKQRSLYTLLIICLLGLFLLPMSNAKTEVKNSEIPDSPLPLTVEKSAAPIRPDRIIPEMQPELQGDVTALREPDNRREKISDQKNEATSSKIVQQDITTKKRTPDTLIDKKPAVKNEIEGKFVQNSTVKNKNSEESLKLDSYNKELNSLDNNTELNSSDNKIPELAETEPEQGSVTSEAVQQPHVSPVDYTALGRSLFKKGEFDDAISDFNKAIRAQPRRRRSLLLQRVCLFFKNPS